jgi:hypothetical protein
MSDPARGLSRAEPRGSTVLAEGHVPHTVPVFFNQDDGALPECFGALRKHSGQPLDDMGSCRVAEPEDDDTGSAPLRHGGDLPEVEVEGQDNARFRYGLCEDVDVGETLEPFVAQVDGLMTHVAQPAHHLHGEPHVGEEPHPAL